jgi:hypothetical protein
MFMLLPVVTFDSGRHGYLANIGTFITISTNFTNIHMIVFATTVTSFTKVIDTA